MSSRAEGISSTTAVVAAVLGEDPAAVGRTLAAVRRQVYGPARVVIAGDGSALRTLASQHDATVVATARELFGGLEASATHVWLLRAGAEPRPDALGALVEEAERTGASVAGSKLLDRDDPQRLLAVGIATDVFDEPYLGIDEDELDHGQYDVVRDVAAVSGASMLVRRDLAVGLGGPDTVMAPDASSIDLCQRARLRGARVVVVPSSEVTFPADRLAADTWREEAGRIRAMLKAYSWVTLLWALPTRFLIGLVDAIFAPLTGRWPLFRFLAAWLATVVTLPSILSSRRRARSGRIEVDEEMFRFQLGGSARLRRLASDLGSGVRARLEAGEGVDFASLGRDLAQPALVAGIVVIGFLVLSTRSLWVDGFPAARLSLPLAESGRDTLAAYAGGWNPAGLGSTAPLRPFLALAGMVQLIVLDRPELAAGAMVLGSSVGGVVGFTRLARRLRLDLIPGIAGGLVFVAGPATRALGDAGAIPTLVGLGLFPWVVLVALSPWPTTGRARVGSVAGAVALAAVLGAASPGLLVAAAAAVVLGWVVRAAPLLSALRSALAAAVGLLFTMPWLDSVDLETYFGTGAAFWEPGALLAIAAAVAAAAALLAAPEDLAPAAIWGSVAAGGAAWVARAHAVGFGDEVEHAALAVVALGSGLVVAVVLEALRRVEAVTQWDRVVVAVGSVGAVLLVASVALVALPGRGGLPADELSGAVRFIEATNGSAPARLLVAGPADTLPGQSRDLEGAAFRVVSAPLPTLDEAWLPAPTIADDALHDALESAATGESFRLGEDLAAFGIRWVLVTGETPLEAVFRSQLDLIPLEGLRRATFVVDPSLTAARAVSSTGDVWDRTQWGYEGSADPDARVRVAETANGRWGPQPWAQVEWANEVSAAVGEVRFEAIERRRLQARVAGGVFVVLLGIAWWGRRGR